MKTKRKIKIAIDSPAAAGAGTQAKMISKHFNLMHLDTGKCYRFIANLKINNPLKFNHKFLKKKIASLKIKDLENKKLLSNEVAIIASQIAKQRTIRQLVHSFQKKCAYSPPKRYAGSCLDGRDICSIIVPDADIKFFIDADIYTRTSRRTKELLQAGQSVMFRHVLRQMQERDARDKSRSAAPLLPADDAIIIDTSKMGVNDVMALALSHITA